MTHYLRQRFQVAQPRRFMMTLMIGIVMVAGLGLAHGADTITQSDADAALTRGRQALALVQPSADQLVAGALDFTRALTYYRSTDQNDLINELQANLYWCKKRMDLDSLQRYVAAKDDETKALAETLVNVADAAVPVTEADSYLARAQAFAQAHPDRHLDIAIRYFEVADRFVGTPASIQAQRQSLAEQRQAAANADVVGARLQTQLAVLGDLPPAAAKIMTELNVASAAITSKASQALQREQASAVDALTKEAETAQRRGALDVVVAIQRQLAALDNAEPGLSPGAATAVASYRAATQKIMDRVQADLASERGKAAKRLDPLQAEETKRGNVPGALAIKNQVAQLQVGAGVQSRNLDLATVKKRFATRQVAWREGTLTLGYDFSDAGQLRDFDVGTAKLKLSKGCIIDVGDRITHKVVWKSLTVKCQLAMPNRGGNHLRLSGGVTVGAHNYNAWIADLLIGSQKLGEATFDEAYTIAGDPNTFVPVTLVATEAKTSLTFGKAVIGKPQGTSVGQLILCSGDGGNQFRSLVLEGIPAEDWLQKP